MRTFAQKPKATLQTTSTKPTTPSRAHFGQSSDVSAILHLQRTIVNQRVQRLQVNATERDSVLTGTSSPCSGYDFGRIPIGPLTTEDTPIQRKASIGYPVDPLVREAGEALDARTRRRFERGLGEPLGDVRVHRGSEAATSAALLGAEAYTVGKHIVFGPGIYAPGTRRGDRVLLVDAAPPLDVRGGHEAA